MNGETQLEFDCYQTTQLQPHSREPVWVQGAGYRCLAVFDDKNGGWRTYYTGKPIKDLIEVLSGPSN
jgi:hypothetical protein